MKNQIILLLILLFSLDIKPAAQKEVEKEFRPDENQFIADGDKY